MMTILYTIYEILYLVKSLEHKTNFKLIKLWVLYFMKKYI